MIEERFKRSIKRMNSYIAIAKIVNRIKLCKSAHSLYPGKYKYNNNNNNKNNN